MSSDYNHHTKLCYTAVLLVDKHLVDLGDADYETVSDWRYKADTQSPKTNLPETG